MTTKSALGKEETNDAHWKTARTDSNYDSVSGPEGSSNQQVKKLLIWGKERELGKSNDIIMY